MASSSWIDVHAQLQKNGRSYFLELAIDLGPGRGNSHILIPMDDNPELDELRRQFPIDGEAKS